jgi:hypothetical protein
VAFSGRRPHTNVVPIQTLTDEIECVRTVPASMGSRHEIGQFLSYGVGSVNEGLIKVENDQQRATHSLPGRGAYDHVAVRSTNTTHREGLLRTATTTVTLDQPIEERYSVAKQLPVRFLNA